MARGLRISILAIMRHPLVRELGLYLAALAIVGQFSLAQAHAVPRIATTIDGAEVAWCGSVGHSQDGGADAAGLGAGCPLCQLPHFGPDPRPSFVTVDLPVWPERLHVEFDGLPAASAQSEFRPILPRAPPAAT
jgi:hypothetical protein